MNYNRNCASVKRLLREAAELSDPTFEYFAQPLEDNLFEWHFTIRGPSDSEFSSGIYHGRILMPPDYPMKPPAFSFLTPNGRFATGEKICLSISHYHPETWLPSWSIRTALIAIISFFTSPGNIGNVGELNYPIHDRKVLALKSGDWECISCGLNRHQLLNDDEKTSQDENGDALSITVSVPSFCTTDFNCNNGSLENKESGMSMLDSENRLENNNEHLELEERVHLLTVEEAIDIGFENIRPIQLDDSNQIERLTEVIPASANVENNTTWNDVIDTTIYGLVGVIFVLFFRRLYMMGFSLI